MSTRQNGNFPPHGEFQRFTKGVAVPDEIREDMAPADVSAPGEARTGKSEISAESSESSQYSLLSRENAQLGRLAAEQADAIAGLDALLSVVGHELRNPMTPMLGKVQLLRRSVHKGLVQPDRIEQSLEQIEWLLLRYIRRASTLLDISRLRGGTLKLQPMVTDIREVVRDVAANLAILADQSGSTLECILPAEAVVGIWDTSALEQILDNLISNAIKFGESRPIEITLGLEGERVVINVVDRGCGIAAEEQSRIFEGFERGSVVGGVRIGLGVGLWLASRLASAMGGSIRVSSAPRQGSVFTLNIPRDHSEYET